MRIAAVLFAALLSFAEPAAAQDPLALAPTAGVELRQMCIADRGRLWGASLCGPLLVVDPNTRRAWASTPDNTGVLRRFGDGWTGALPEGVAMANTSADWGGTRWITVIGPFPDDPTDRRVLIGHEAWRRIQPTLGLQTQASDYAHLQTERGRYLMRLEFRALGTALRSRARARQDAAREALMFRFARLAEFSAAAYAEAALDRSEGLAAYTGVKLGAGEDAEMYAARRLDDYDTLQDFAQTYARASGPAYGLLLDEAQPAWRASLARYAPADLLAGALRATPVDAARLYRAAQRYGGDAIIREERTRQTAQIIPNSQQ